MKMPHKERKMGSIGMPELVVIMVVAMIIFGAGKLPQIGENLGEAIRDFKKSTHEKEETELPLKKWSSTPTGQGFRVKVITLILSAFITLTRQSIQLLTLKDIC
jgi:sec-independent protein translocase protein TatA